MSIVNLLEDSEKFDTKKVSSRSVNQEPYYDVSTLRKRLQQHVKHYVSKSRFFQRLWGTI